MKHSLLELMNWRTSSALRKKKPCNVPPQADAAPLEVFKADLARLGRENDRIRAAARSAVFALVKASGKLSQLAPEFSGAPAHEVRSAARSAKIAADMLDTASRIKGQ